MVTTGGRTIVGALSNYGIFAILLLLGLNQTGAALIGTVIGLTITSQKPKTKAESLSLLGIGIGIIIIMLSILEIVTRKWNILPLIAYVVISIGIQYLHPQKIVRKIQERQIPAILKTKTFLTVLGIKIVAAFLFVTNELNSQIIPFVEVFINNGFENPYRLLGEQTIFPYGSGMLYVLAIPKIMFAWIAQSSVMANIFVTKIPILLADIVIFYYLCLLLKEKTRIVEILYWCSPITLYINYIGGWLDAIPIALLVAGIYYLTRNRWGTAALLLGISIATKTGIVLIIPLIVAYAIKQKMSIMDIIRYGSIGLIMFAAISGPFLLSAAYREATFKPVDQQKSLGLNIPISSNFQFFLLPAVYIVLVLYAFSFKRMNKEMLLMLTALVFTAIVTLTPPLPNWYFWIIPFLVYFFAKEKKVHMMSYIAFTILYLAYFLVWKGSNIFNSFQNISRAIATLPTPYLMLGSLGFQADMIVNVLFTLLTSSLALCAYWIYKYGIQSNLLYKDRDTPLLIGIAGDSGVGKTTFSTILVDLFGRKFTTILSGDDMHKWERGDKHWETMTHLNPSANYLHAEIKNLESLKEESAIRRRVYNHEDGRFTEPKRIEANKFVILEGLHSFYINAVRNLCDIKIFLDTDEDLRKHWKIQRDLRERGHSKEKVLEALKKREKEAEKYITPQKKFADIIISFSPKTKIKNLGAESDIQMFLKMTMENSLDINEVMDALAEVKTLHVQHRYENDLAHQTIIYEGVITRQEVEKIVERTIPNYRDIILNSPVHWQENYNGIIQIVLVYIVSQKLKRERQ